MVERRWKRSVLIGRVGNRGNLLLLIEGGGGGGEEGRRGKRSKGRTFTIAI